MQKENTLDKILIGSILLITGIGSWNQKVFHLKDFEHSQISDNNNNNNLFRFLLNNTVCIRFVRFVYMYM